MYAGLLRQEIRYQLKPPAMGWECACVSPNVIQLILKIDYWGIRGNV